MLDAYDVLGVVPRAPQRDVRAAYVELAKQLHPDRNADQEAAKRRFQRVNQAYELLKDPDRRSLYDTLRAQKHDAVRRRRRQAATAMAAGFMLTIAVASTLFLFAPFAQPDGGSGASPDDTAATTVPKNLGAAAAPVERLALAAEVPTVAEPIDDIGLEPREDREQIPLDGLAQASVSAGDARAAAAALTDRPDRAMPSTWATLRNHRFGFSLQYPADMFDAEGTDLGDFWRLLVSRDGRARLLVIAGYNSKRATPASYRQSLLDEVYATATITYGPLRKTWFVLAGNRGEDKFYERATFACDGRIIHGWRLTYPAAERDHYVRIIARMHQEYRHAQGAGSHCHLAVGRMAAALKRRVVGAAPTGP